MVHAIITIYYYYHFIEDNIEAQGGWISKPNVTDGLFNFNVNGRTVQWKNEDFPSSACRGLT